MSLVQIVSGKKKLIIRLLAVVVAAVIAMVTLFAPSYVQVVRLQNRDLTAQVYGNGTVEAKVVVGISGRISGRIVELYADQGDRVARGQLLARLESDDLVQQQQQSEAGVNRAAATLKVETANLQKARANMIVAENNARRYKALLDSGMVSRQEAEQYENIYQVAKEDVARGVAVIEAVRMEQAANRSGLGFARSKVADTLIHAPCDGIVISRDLEKGAVATPGQVVFTLADPSTIWVRANVDESQLKGVAVGKNALIKLRSLPGEQFAGHVARLGRQSDRVTEELEVDVAFREQRRDVHLGEQAEVFITTEAKVSVPALPAAVMTSVGKKRCVWVVKNGRLALREVTFGIRDRGDFIEVLGGLDRAEPVVIAEPAQMAVFREGMKVRVR